MMLTFKQAILGLAPLLISTFSSALAAGQTTEGAVTTQGEISHPEISPTKRELIKKLLTISEADKRAKAVMDAMLAENEKVYGEVLSRIVNQDPNLTPQQKKDIQNNLEESTRRFSQRYRELLPQRVNLQQVTEEVALKVYDKYFTEPELTDLFNFYSTPTGQKAVQKMPELVQESIQLTSNILVPKLQTLIMDLVEEEKARWRK